MKAAPTDQRGEVQCREDFNVFPLSIAQRRLWLFHQREQARSICNIPHALVVFGDLDADTLARSLSELVRRHDVLRTSFREIEGEPMQYVVPHYNLTMLLTDLRKLAPAERMSRARQLVENEVWTPFNLAEGPLLRAKLLQTDEQRHVLFLVLHHLIYDEWSEGILMHELLAAYEAFADGRQPELSELPIHYADYAKRQRTLVESRKFEMQLQYWRTQLSDLPILELPVDRGRPLEESFSGDCHRIDLPPRLVKNLKEISTNEGATLFMTMLAAFQVLLSRYSGQEDIVVASNFDHRDEDTDHLIGVFSNIYLCRTRLQGNPTFSEVVQRVREMVLEAYQNQDLPFESIVEALTPKGAQPNQFCQVMFSLRRDPPKSYSIRDLRLERIEIEDRSANSDLSLRLFDGQDGVWGHLNYKTDLFDSATIKGMSGHFQTLVQSIAANPEARILELSLFDPTEKEKILVQWNDTYRDYPCDVHLHQLIEAQVRRTPDAVAVVFEGEQVTYSELNRRANRLAHHLRKLGVNPEIIVGVFAERSIEMVVGLVATLKAGGAYLPLDPSYPVERLRFMIDDAQPRVVLAQRSLAARLPREVKNLVFLEGDFAGESEGNPPNNTQPENLAYLIYTSGSTGQPKGVMNTHRGICNWLLWLRETYPLTADDRILQKTIFTFDVSLGEFFWSLISGSQLVIARPALHGDSQYLIQTICENRITAIHFVPSMLSAFLEDKNAKECSSLRHVICIGEALPTELQERFFAVLPQTQLHNLYGPTEAAVVVTYWKCKRGSSEHIVPIGRPVANTQIYILDRLMQPVPIGAVGEIHIGGVQLARGYLGRPELTAERFVQNPFGEERLYKTGDLGRYRKDGEIEFLGRSDHQVKVRGFRIELGEIETALKKDPAAHGAVVVARKSPLGETRLVAYVAGDVSQLKVRELRSMLKTQLPSYMVPSAIVLLEKLPLSLNGKIDRQALPAPSVIRAEEPFVEARDTLEAQLVAIWEGALGMEPIGVTDDFFEIGGDSILALRIFTEIQKELGQNLPLATLFERPTVENLAAALRQEGWKPNWSPIVAVQPHGSHPPFFCVHGGFGGVLCYGHLSRCLGTDQPFYSLQAEGLDGGPINHPTIPSMATYYLGEMRRIQTHGPYFLGGYSFGGVVAFEMAHQLHAAGEKVALLVLFDSLDDQNPPPRAGLSSKARELFSLTRNWSKLANTLVRRLQKARSLLAQAKLLGHGSASTPPSAVQVVQASNIRALSNYELRPYPGPVTLFRAEDRDDGYAHPEDNGWTQFAGGGIEIHRIPGEHQAIFTQPHVNVLAEKLDTCLRAAFAGISPR